MPPGAAWVEKDAIYTNEQGLVQASSKASPHPAKRGRIRRSRQYRQHAWSDHALPELGRCSEGDLRSLAGIKVSEAHTIAFARPISASNWLQASNPSERWKWDFLYQDLPPVKGHNVQMEGTGASPSFIPLKPVD